MLPTRKRGWIPTLQRAQEEGLDLNRITALVFYGAGDRLHHGVSDCKGQYKQYSDEHTLAELLEKPDLYCDECTELAATDNGALIDVTEDIEKVLRGLNQIEEAKGAFERHEAITETNSKLVYGHKGELGEWFKAIADANNLEVQDLIEDHAEELRVGLQVAILEKAYQAYGPPELEKYNRQISRAHEKLYKDIIKDPRRVLYKVRNHGTGTGVTSWDRLMLNLWKPHGSVMQLPLAFVTLPGEKIILDEALTETQLETIRVLQEDGGVYKTLKAAHLAAMQL